MNIREVSKHPEQHKNLWRFVNLTERLLLGPLTIPIETPNEVVWMWEKSTLIRYLSPTRKVKFKTPILIVPPLMVKPTIFDLRPGHSMVAFLVNYGFQVFMVDFGIPEKHDKYISVDHYVNEFIPEAIKKIVEFTGAHEVSLIGWSMGGIMSLLYTAIFDNLYVKNLVTIGSPVNYSKMFPFNILAKLIELPGIKRAIDLMGNIPPVLTKNGFRILTPLKNMQRYITLVKNYWDREWVSAYETINDWIEDFIPYPGEAFKQFVSEFIKDDKLRKGQLKIGSRYVDLSRIRVNVLAFVGTTDIIAPRASVEAIKDFLPNSRVELQYVPLGHIGLVAGSEAPEYVWKPMAKWLAERSEEMGVKAA